MLFLAPADFAFVAIVGVHALAVLLIAGTWLAGVDLHERPIVRISSAASSAAVVLSLLAAVLGAVRHVAPHTIDLGDWFRVGAYTFPLTLRVDGISLVMANVASVLVALIGAFSVRYLHRERGFLRFYLLLHLMAFGALTLFTAGSLDVMVVGWELLGISSALLVAFFDNRPDPVRGSIFVFSTYRMADIGLLVGIVAVHHLLGTTRFDEFHAVDGAAVAGVLLLIGASGKSAQLPFSGWLTRAMEGPTPSSAVFYGAVSIHAGAFLLLRAEPLIAQAWLARGAIIGVGVATALYATVCGRAASDAKSSVAFATMTQVGLIFAEIGLGFTTFALVHIIGNACVRTVQLLRAPSMLLEHQQIHAAAGGVLTQPGRIFRRTVPAPLEKAVFSLAVEPAFIDHVLARLWRPVLAIAAAIDRLDSRFAAAVDPDVTVAAADDDAADAAPAVAGGRHV